MRIVLVGYMGSGKSTAGKKLASKLGFSFLDTDLLIEEEYKIAVPDELAETINTINDAVSVVEKLVGNN